MSKKSVTYFQVPSSDSVDSFRIRCVAKNEEQQKYADKLYGKLVDSLNNNDRKKMLKTLKIMLKGPCEIVDE